MAKVSIRIPLPKDQPSKFIELMEKVVKEHEALGAASLLHNNNVVDMAAFKAKLLQAIDLRDRSIAARKEAEALMGQAKVILGTTFGQTINTPDTLYYELDKIKKILLVKSTGTEQDLESYGFHVVKGTTKRVGRKRKPRP